MMKACPSVQVRVPMFIARCGSPGCAGRLVFASLADGAASYRCSQCQRRVEMVRGEIYVVPQPGFGFARACTGPYQGDDRGVYVAMNIIAGDPEDVLWPGAPCLLGDIEDGPKHPAAKVVAPLVARVEAVLHSVAPNNPRIGYARDESTREEFFVHANNFSRPVGGLEPGRRIQLNPRPSRRGPGSLREAHRVEYVDGGAPEASRSPG